MDSGRALPQILIHELAAGITSGRHPVDSTDPPRWTSWAIANPQVRALSHVVP
ncbi:MULTISPECIES: hypothetical protein [unclassified Streptomyces]|uniref:hypothetical protein n=1 Tax=unclassified Streptomyces TaxID=2593676 RepID=UPI002E2A9621|nr:hypothetical protein [Streptomyces sp. NBC_00228]